MSAFVVDANVMNYFQEERLNGPGVAHNAIQAIFQSNFIALDEGGHCRQEWLDCAAGAFPLALSDWINDQLVMQRIRLFISGNNPTFKELAGIGIPQKDHKWIKLSVSSNAAGLVTEDIDLIDPSAKKASSKTKESIKTSCRGPVAKALKKKFDVKVMCCQHVPEACGCS